MLFITDHSAAVRGEGAHNAAFIGAVVSYFQDAPVDHAMFYRADAVWMGLFDLRGAVFQDGLGVQGHGKDAEHAAAVCGRGYRHVWLGRACRPLRRRQDRSGIHQQLRNSIECAECAPQRA